MKRKTWLLTSAAVLAGGIAASSVLAATSGAKDTALAAAETAPNTAKVVRGTLTAVVAVNGTLTYQGQPDGSPFSVINQASGIYTELPAVGQIVSQGHVAYQLNGNPVVLLYGPTPAYRALAAGVTGLDVAELNADLVDLDYATAAQLSPTSAVFGSATTTAVEKLQAALGETQTGTLALGRAVFEPTALRVTALSVEPGESSQTNQTVMQGTSTTRVVQVALDAAQQSDVAVGDKVTITLPDNQITLGVVSSVGTVATCPSSTGSAQTTTDSAAPGADTCSSTNAGSISAPTISVGVSPSDPAATGTWDQAPVQVGITTTSVPDALAVPVTALLAQAGGSYSVEVVGAGGADHLVAVSLGLFDDAAGLVQVTGSGLVAGQTVVVPAL